ncbi:hypothetical protein TNCV_992821 [Trichonephila clavipes]|nr:hypothetical protein TNCV_992821 [Trichonephila clavipes]
MPVCDVFRFDVVDSGGLEVACPLHETEAAILFMTKGTEEPHWLEFQATSIWNNFLSSLAKSCSKAVAMFQLPTRWRYSISTSAPFNQSPSSNRVPEKDTNLALSLTFSCISIELPL